MNKIIVSILIFFTLSFLLFAFFTIGRNLGRRQMFIELQIILHKAGVDIFDGGKFKEE